jgi:TonB-dependent starch-binding outer membrane protein SusC
MNSYYGHEIIGVWQVGDDFSTSSQNPQPGDWKYKDQLTVDTDGDGVADAADGIINADDKVILGSPVPDFTWGITNDLSYKNLSLSFNIQGVYGADLLNNTRVQSYYPINFRRNKLADAYVNRWTPDNPTNEYASFINPSSQGTNSVNSKTVENASYIKLQNVTLSYKIPTKGKVFDAFSVYVSGTNLITLSGYSGMDPGANVLGTSANAARMDYDPYPMARTFSVGVNVGF